MLVHINRPRGYYLGMIRIRGCRKWTIVTGRCRRGETALAKAVMKMGWQHSRARSVFFDMSGYYEPRIAIEACR